MSARLLGHLELLSDLHFTGSRHYLPSCQRGDFAMTLLIFLLSFLHCPKNESYNASCLSEPQEYMLLYHSTFVVRCFQDMETKQVFPTDCIQQLKMLPAVIYLGTFNPRWMNDGSFLLSILRGAGIPIVSVGPAPPARSCGIPSRIVSSSVPNKTKILFGSDCPSEINGLFPRALF